MTQRNNTLDAVTSLAKQYGPLIKADHLLANAWDHLLDTLADQSCSKKDREHGFLTVIRLLEEDRNDLIHLDDEGPDNDGAQAGALNDCLLALNMIFTTFKE